MPHHEHEDGDAGSACENRARTEEHLCSIWTGGLLAWYPPEITEVEIKSAVAAKKMSQMNKAQRIADFLGGHTGGQNLRNIYPLNSPESKRTPALWAHKFLTGLTSVNRC
jgi:hypothetical protein